MIFRARLIAPFLGLSSLLYAGVVKAATDYNLLVPLPLNGSGGNQNTINFNTYVSNGYQFMIVLAGVCAVVMIVWGGFDYILTDAVSGKSAGKKKINSALIGLLLALSSYVILNTINSCLTNVGTKDGNILPPIGTTESRC